MPKSKLRLMTLTAGLFAAALATAGMSASAGATVQPLNASGCNGDACIFVTGPASGYSALAADEGLGSNRQYILQVFGPGCPDKSTPVEHISGASISCKGHGAGTVCAFISEFDASVGAFLNAGEPCETVH